MELSEQFGITNVDDETMIAIGVISGSHFLNHMYLILLPPIFSILAAEFDVSLTALGFAVGILGGFNMLFQLPFGYLSDNYSRSLTLVVGLGTSAAAVLVLSMAPSSNFTWVYASQALLGIGIASHHPAHYPMLSDAVEEQNRGRVFSLHGVAGNLGYAATPAVITVVLLFPTTTWRHALLLIGIVGGTYTVLAGFLLNGYVDREVTGPSPSADSGRESDISQLGRQVVDEVRSIITSPAILALGVLSLLTALASWGIRSYAVVLLTDGYDVTLNTSNTAFTAMFVTSAVLILVGGDLSDRISAMPILFGSYALLFAAAVAIASFLATPLLAIVLVILTGSALSLGQPAREKLTDLLSAQANLGRNFAIITVGISLGGTLAPPIFGAVIDTYGFQAAFYLIGGLGVVGGTLALAIFHRHRRSLAGQRESAQ